MDFGKSYKKYNTQQKWVKASDDVELLVSPMNQTLNAFSMQSIVKPGEDIKNNESLLHEVTIKTMVKNCLHGWKNVSLNGKDLEFSKDVALDLCFSSIHFYTMVSLAIAEMSGEFEKEQEELEKN